MRLLELAFKWDGLSLRAVLAGPHHVIVVPGEVPPSAFRDALVAAFYVDAPAPESPGVRNVGLSFEAANARYRLIADLVTGRRALQRTDGTSQTLVADQPESVSQALAGLLHLPGVEAFRALLHTHGDLLGSGGPRIPAGAHRGLLAHAENPARLRAELEAATVQAEAAKAAARKGAPVPPARDAWVLGLAVTGLGSTLAAGLAGGDARMLGLLTPVLLGGAAWRSLRWVDASEGRASSLAAQDEADGVVRARRRQLEELEGHLSAIERSAGDRTFETVLRVLKSDAESGVDGRVRDRVQVYAGASPSASTVADLTACLGRIGVDATLAVHILAAMQLREARAAPLLWVDSDRENIPWEPVFDQLPTRTSLLVFGHRAAGPRSIALAAPAHPPSIDR